MMHDQLPQVVQILPTLTSLSLWAPVLYSIYMMM